MTAVGSQDRGHTGGRHQLSGGHTGGHTNEPRCPSGDQRSVGHLRLVPRSPGREPGSNRTQQAGDVKDFMTPHPTPAGTEPRQVTSSCLRHLPAVEGDGGQCPRGRSQTGPQPGAPRRPGVGDLSLCTSRCHRVSRGLGCGHLAPHGDRASVPRGGKWGNRSVGRPSVSPAPVWSPSPLRPPTGSPNPGLSPTRPQKAFCAYSRDGFP
jgi:hypothetical protein